jgi:hypothetical protein
MFKLRRIYRERDTIKIMKGKKRKTTDESMLESLVFGGDIHPVEEGAKSSAKEDSKVKKAAPNKAAAWEDPDDADVKVDITGG